MYSIRADFGFFKGSFRNRPGSKGSLESGSHSKKPYDSSSRMKTAVGRPPLIEFEQSHDERTTDIDQGMLRLGTHTKFRVM